jgi:FkbM family methyltransferase
MHMSWQSWRRRAENLRRHPHPLRFLASRALWSTGLSSLFTTQLRDGLKVRFFPSSISAALWVQPDARDDDAEVLRLLLRAADTYVDCGANIGHLALVARQLVGQTGRVVAIEANPRIHRYCQRNLDLNEFSDVQTINVALGETAGTITISDQHSDDQNVVGQGTTTVPLCPLDSVLTSGAVTLLKLDVEGFELPVLRGAKQTLERTSFVYCELSASNAARYGYDAQDAESLLLAAGFVLARPTAAGWQITERSVFETLSESDLPATGFNLLAINRRAVTEFEKRVAERGQHVAY